MSIDKGLLGGSTSLLVLTILKNEDKYGFEIIRELEEKSDNTFQFKEGTLYPILHKLENKGYLTSYKEQGDRGRKRKYYSITKSGIKQLVEEEYQWEEFSTAIKKVIGGEAHVII